MITYSSSKKIRIFEEKIMDDKTISLQYNTFRWGPLLVKIKVEEEMLDLFLKEGKASQKDMSSRLAGVLNKEVEFRDRRLFVNFFSNMFNLYADAQFKWNAGKGNSREHYKQQYSLDALWCNFQGAGDFNPPHDHGGALSWVIFLQIPEELKEENKKYEGRSAGPGGITFIYSEGPKPAITHHSFFPEEGDMFIFPAWLKHWVFPFKSNCTRISVSGNVDDSIKLKHLEQFNKNNEKQKT